MNIPYAVLILSVTLLIILFTDVNGEDADLHDVLVAHFTHD